MTSVSYSKCWSVTVVLSNINIILKYYLIITKIKLFYQVWLMWWFGLVVWGVWEIEVLLICLRSKNVDVYHGLFCFPPSQPPSVQKAVSGVGRLSSLYRHTRWPLAYRPISHTPQTTNPNHQSKPPPKPMLKRGQYQEMMVYG